MEFETFIRRLEEVKDISLIENGYSHIIYNVLYDHVLNSEYMLVDVSTYKRWYDGKPKNIELLSEGLCAVPDFVITNKVTSLKNINRLGCIEVKFNSSDVNGERLDDENDEKGYLSVYNHNVIYTNGWIWKYYAGDKNDKGENVPCWIFDFSQEEQKNAKTYYMLLMKLNEIKWDKGFK